MDVFTRQITSLGIIADRPVIRDYVPRPHDYDPRRRDAQTFSEFLFEVSEDFRDQTKKKPAVIVAMLPASGSNSLLYQDLKNFGNVTYGVPTQAMIDRKAFKGNGEQYAANVILKVREEWG